MFAVLLTSEFSYLQEGAEFHELGRVVGVSLGEFSISGKVSLGIFPHAHSILTASVHPVDAISYSSKSYLDP